MIAAIEGAQLILDSLCSKVKLSRDSIPVIDISIPIPEGTCLWSGDYACLLLWPLAGQTSESIRESVERAQDYFDEVLVAKEGQLTSYDGYLVLALDSQPVGDMNKIVQEVELSTSVCRKNVIWPTLGITQSEREWPRIADVAVLGLPDIPIVPEEHLSWPDVGDDVRRLWQELNSTAYLKVSSKVEKYGER
ncbi:hypothetical protein [Pseudomonas huaxiensis]|uniref:hypothetical protein n=1 Tax=Pseudomonas huaxiensis TaxID=2213017 RepID=UPI001300B8A6|nr:hypothetical protein [Pseudomonas huaxiensis]